MKNLVNLRKLMLEKECDGLAIVPGPNLFHLTGVEFHISERPVVLFVTTERLIFVLPELELPKIAALEVEVFSYDDHGGTKSAFEALSESFSCTKLGVESRIIRYLELDLITTNSISEKIRDATDIFAEMRMRKSEHEIEYMREAVKIAEKSLTSVLHKMKVGITERQFASELVVELLKRGSEAHLPFSPIVASGLNAANPHHFASDKEFRENELVIVDWGANFRGYYSDITRTFAIGNNLNSRLISAHEAVKEANRIGRETARLGVEAGLVDLKTRRVIEDSGFAEFFTHRTGHGLGLEIHEEPYISPNNQFVLDEGMTFTIEPGIYLPNLGGIRIEDDVYLNKSGLESLTTLPRELIVI